MTKKEKTAKWRQRARERARDRAWRDALNTIRRAMVQLLERLEAADR